jgi:hypothetical protein
MANITNVSTIKRIPLFQVSQSFNYIFSVIAVFILLLSLQLLEASYLIFMLFSFSSIAIILLSNLWMVEDKDRRTLIVYSALSLISIILVIILLLLTDMKPLFRTGIISFVLFLFLGYYYLFSKQKRLSLMSRLQLLLAVVAIFITLYISLNR